MTAPGVLIAPEVLDELLTLASAGHFAAGASETLHARGGSQTAQEQSHAATQALLKLCQRLQALGAREEPPTDSRRHPAPVSNPLAELARVEGSRPEALALLDALRHAHQLAEALDAKRGDGDAWGERIYQAVCGLELELYGPGGAVTGARE